MYPVFFFEKMSSVQLQIRSGAHDLSKSQVEHEWLCESAPQKTNITLENQPFEDVSPIENGDFPFSC